MKIYGNDGNTYATVKEAKEADERFELAQKEAAIRKEESEKCAVNEKKEPEIEWVYRVFGAENNGEKFFQTEEEAIKRCEELAKSQKSKQYARYERVCRVKAVE